MVTKESFHTCERANAYAIAVRFDEDGAQVNT